MSDVDPSPVRIVIVISLRMVLLGCLVWGTNVISMEPMLVAAAILAVVMPEVRGDP